VAGLLRTLGHLTSVLRSLEAYFCPVVLGAARWEAVLGLCPIGAPGASLERLLTLIRCLNFDLYFLLVDEYIWFYWVKEENDALKLQLRELGLLTWNRHSVHCWIATVRGLQFKGSLLTWSILTCSKLDHTHQIGVTYAPFQFPNNPSSRRSSSDFGIASSMMVYLIGRIGGGFLEG
jgi:hypothetical protein